MIFMSCDKAITIVSVRKLIILNNSSTHEICRHYHHIYLINLNFSFETKSLWLHYTLVLRLILLFFYHSLSKCVLVILYEVC